MIDEGPNIGYRRLSIGLTLLGGLASVTILLIFAVYAKPLGDDYCFATAPDAISLVKKYYFELHSRWFTNFLIGLALAGHDPRLAYPWVPLLTMVGVLIGFRLLAGALVRPDRAVYTEVFALSTCLFFWCNQPSPGDGMFWALSALDYDAAFPLMFLLFSLLVRNHRSGVWIAVMAVIAFLLGPHNELFAAAALFCFTILAIWMWRTRHPDRILFTVLALVCLAGLLTVVLAPGQNNRLLKLTHSRALLPVTLRAAWSLVLWLPDWVLDWNLWAGTALLWLFAPNLHPIRNTVPLGLTAVLWLGGLCSGFWVLSYAVGGAVPGRCLNFFYLWFLTGWIVLAFAIREHVWTDKPMESPAAGIARIVLPPALAWGLFLLGNPMVGLVDLRTRLFPWLKAKSERMRLLEEAGRSGVEHLSLPALPPFPRLYFDFDPEENPRLPQNRCAAKFYGLGSVTVPQDRSRDKLPLGATLTGKSHGREQFR